MKASTLRPDIFLMLFGRAFHSDDAVSAKELFLAMIALLWYKRYVGILHIRPKYNERFIE